MITRNGRARFSQNAYQENVVQKNTKQAQANFRRLQQFVNSQFLAANVQA